MSVRDDATLKGTAIPGNPAAIPAAANSPERPFLSVMIPTWQPRLDYLEAAVRSVLNQLDASRDAQIEIVDDCSPDFDPHAFVNRFAPRTISAHRHECRRGLAGNWNACLSRARGRWVHLLHQDDLLLPGFYDALLSGAAAEPNASAAYCGSYLMDAEGSGWAPRLVRMQSPGVLEDWREHVFVRLSIQCSAIIVRRDAYEMLGGFDPGLKYALDWDMWKRLAVQRTIWFHPEPLACYRMHPGSETGRQRASGGHLREIFRSIDASAALLAPGDAARVTRRAKRRYVMFAAEQAIALGCGSGLWSDALAQLRIARQESSAATVAAALAKVAARTALRAITGTDRKRPLGQLGL